VLISSQYVSWCNSADTMTCQPRTTILNVLSVQEVTLCGPLYGGSKTR
jgi:hypothetical protein